MKRIFLIGVAASFVLLSCNNDASTGASTQGSDTTASASAAAISFTKNSFDFGKVKEGEKVTHEFRFKNEGTEPLIISNASASCGCTVPEFPKEPIAPGKEGAIKVVFDSAGRPGMQHKVVTVTSNANPATTELYLTGEVLANNQVKTNN